MKREVYFRERERVLTQENSLFSTDLCPDLPVFASVSLQTGVYKVGTSWTYTCAEGRYPVSGSGTYKCEFTKEWLAPNPGLICKSMYQSCVCINMFTLVSKL